MNKGLLKSALMWDAEFGGRADLGWCHQKMTKAGMTTDQALAAFKEYLRRLPTPCTWDYGVDWFGEPYQERPRMPRVQKGWDDLDLKAFDDEGQFVGSRSIADQLIAARERLDPADFRLAVAYVFGIRGLPCAMALADGRTLP